MPKPSVFLSYSHQDEDWKTRLRTHLKVLEHVGTFEVWDDRRIDTGATWFDEIREAMDGAAAAVCLISADYLASDFVNKEEIPYLLERRRRDGMLFLPILLENCAWKKVPWLRDLQMVPSGRTVKDFHDKGDKVFSEVAELLADRLAELGAGGVLGEARTGYRAVEVLQPEKVDLARLPITGAELFGRQAELDWLDSAWDERKLRVVALVAWGGMGKSTLVNKWLERLKADGYRAARRVFGWSFYSQGTSERATSADLFIATALEFFGDPNPKEGSPWSKGERLAELVRRDRNLLILDGLEPLQSPTEEGRVKDPALATLLARLARSGAGTPALCVISTRESLGDLVEFPENTESKDLERISPEAGRALLRVGGVRGTDAELEDATRAFGGHAMAMILLAAYLRSVPGHPIAASAELPNLDIAEKKGRHPRRLMEAFARRYGSSSEIELLSVLGLFNRPAEHSAVSVVRALPPVNGLTERLATLDEAAWLRCLARLRIDRLLAEENPRDPGTLDCHPIVREHFGGKVKQENPTAWCEAHGRLFEYYKSSTERLPETLKEMAPLYAAMAHGCEAGRYQEALDQIFRARIERSDEFFATYKLGAAGADLAALAGLFDPPWRRPVVALRKVDRVWVLGSAGFRLQALGRLAEAEEAMRSALDGRLALEHWEGASIEAINLCDLHLGLGNLKTALDFARQSLEFAERSGDVFVRMVSRASCANVLHQAGRDTDAEKLFREAEVIQRELLPSIPSLVSVRGFHYCDLLLDQGRWRDVEQRAEQAIARSRENRWLLDVALDHLSLGRAALIGASAEGKASLTRATDHLDLAVEGLRSASQLDELPRGLLARAELSIIKNDAAAARADLDETLAIATRAGMRLYEADAHLRFARLHLAEGDRPRARESLERARKLVEETGYHRRDKEVEELARQLRPE